MLMRWLSTMQLLAAAVAAAAVLVAGCELDEDAARPVHASFELRPGEEARADGETWFPDREDVIRGVIVLEPVAGEPGAGGEGADAASGEAMKGLLVITAGDDSRVREIEARYDGGVIRLEEGASTIPGTGFGLNWQLFELSLEDRSGDGVLDAGTGTASGRVESIMYAQAFSDGVITAEPDVRSAEVRLSASGIDSDRAFPYEVLFVRFTKPVIADRAAEGLALLVDGEPAAASVDVGRRNAMPGFAGGGEIATFATLAPDEPLPLGAELVVEPRDLVDLSGHDVSGGDDLAVAADLGSAHDNLDFSADFDGWHRTGAVALQGAFEGAEPDAQGRFAVLRERSQLAAELSLPQDADSIALRVTGFAEWYAVFPEGELIVDVLYRDGDEVSSANFGPVAEEDMIECEQGCQRFMHRSEALPVALDVGEAAGEDVFLRITLQEHRPAWPAVQGQDGSLSQPPPSFAAAVEDLRIELAGD